MADGTRVPHMGENAFAAYTDQGHLRNIVAGVTEVDDALLSVSKVVKAGNRVVFEDGNSFIENKISKQMIPMEERNGEYVLKVWINRDQASPF